MAYINRIIGPEEKLIGIARLHWIYILKGVAWFLICALFGWALNTGVMMFLRMLGPSVEVNDTTLPFFVISGWIIPAFLVAGIIIFLIYFIKVLSTEIGLSNRRVIHKNGLVFVNVHEIDIEEIRGERLDLGLFGRFLGYGYLHLDCRFIGDVQLPAIENPERFLKALHDVRSKSMESITMVMGKGKGMGVKLEDQPQQPPNLDLPPPPELTQEEQRRIIALYQLEQQRREFLRMYPNAQLPPNLSALPYNSRAHYQHSDAQSPHQAIMEDLEHGPEIPAQPVNPPSEPQQQPAAVNPAVVAQIVEQIVPQVVEKMAEQVTEKVAAKTAPRMTAKMKAEGLRAQPPLEKAEVPLEEELLVSFDEASSTLPPDSVQPDQKPEPKPEQSVH